MRCCRLLSRLFGDAIVIVLLLVVVVIVVAAVDRSVGLFSLPVGAGSVVVGFLGGLRFLRLRRVWAIECGWGACWVEIFREEGFMRDFRSKRKGVFYEGFFVDISWFFGKF